MSRFEDNEPSETHDADPKADPTAGMIGKRVLMPLGMWSEILELSRRGGSDHRDVLLQLLDRGLQAQDADRFKPRFVPLSAELLDRISVAAKAHKITEEEALVRLVDLGIQSQAEDLARTKPPSPKGTVIQFELNGEPLARTKSRTVPDPGEVVTIDGAPYTVRYRGWSLVRSGLVAYVCLSHYKPEKT